MSWVCVVIFVLILHSLKLSPSDPKKMMMIVIKREFIFFLLLSFQLVFLLIFSCLFKQDEELGLPSVLLKIAFISVLVDLKISTYRIPIFSLFFAIAASISAIEPSSTKASPVLLPPA